MDQPKPILDSVAYHLVKKQLNEANDNTADYNDLLSSAVSELEWANKMMFEGGDGLSESKISYYVCVVSKNCIDKLLKAFLLSRDVDIIPLNTTNALYDACMELDTALPEISIDRIRCANVSLDSETTFHCSSKKSIEMCLHEANDLATFVQAII